MVHRSKIDNKMGVLIFFKKLFSEHYINLLSPLLAFTKHSTSTVVTPVVYL